MRNIVEKGISLSDTIGAIQDELIKSQKKRKDQNKPALFETDRLVLEANCIITKNVAVEGGVEFKLIPCLPVDAKADYASEKSMVHKITIEFKTVSSETTETRKLMGEMSGKYPKATVLKSPER
ncbi:MAG: hypothetical protein NC416_09920 [Eubacterium sp.]|nr:hypothetical protein [Eubacterium sp.]